MERLVALDVHQCFISGGQGAGPNAVLIRNTGPTANLSEQNASRYDQRKSYDELLREVRRLPEWKRAVERRNRTRRATKEHLQWKHGSLFSGLA
jgi:hypothetical protein